MYNGIGLTTARGSGTNGYVQRNISAIRKTKEKIPDYHEKEDNAVRPFDPELVEHDRRRQAEVRCMELRDLLEEQDLPESEIEKKVNDFRNKLLAEKKLTYQRDASGRPVVKDSHEFSVAQEQKNSRAKDAFGIRADFIPGQSLEGKFGENMSKEQQEKLDIQSAMPGPQEKSPEKEKAKKRKKSHKRSKRSSSSSAASSDDESRRKKRKKEKKKKSKKSHRHRRDSLSKRSRKNSGKESDHEEVDGNRNVTKSAPVLSTSSTCCISIASSGSGNSNDSDHTQDQHLSENGGDENSKYSLSVVDFSGHHKYYPSLPHMPKSNGKLSPIEAFQRACIPLLASVAEQTPSVLINGGNNSIGHHNQHSDRSRSSSSDSKYSSRSCSRSITRHSKSRSRTRTPSVSRSHRSLSSRSKSCEKSQSKSRSRSRSISSHSRSHSRSRTPSHSLSSRSRSHSSHSSKHSSSRSRSRSPKSATCSPKSERSRKSRTPSIPRRRGRTSPSFMERRRITSARKRPITYKRKDAVEWNVSSSSESDD